MINEICRVSLEERNYDYPEKSVSSIFHDAPLVDEPDFISIESKKRKDAKRADELEALNERNKAYRAELAIAKKIEASL